jgi:hypothetical protein
MLDLDRLASDTCSLRCDSAKNFLGMLLHACFVLSRRILDHLRVDRDRMKRRQDRQHGDFGADPLGQGDVVLDSFPGEFRPVRWYRFRSAIITGIIIIATYNYYGYGRPYGYYGVPFLRYGW